MAFRFGVNQEDSIFENRSGCNSEEEIFASVIATSKPKIVSFDVTNTTAAFEFTESSTADTLFPIEGYNASCVGARVAIERRGY